MRAHNSNITKTMLWTLLANRQGQSRPKRVEVSGFCNIVVNLIQ